MLTPQQVKTEVKKPSIPAFESELPEAKMKKPVQASTKFVEVPKAEILKPVKPRVEAQKMVEVPKIAAPKIEAPKIEAPKIEAPKIVEPKVEAPKIEAPKLATS